MKPFNFGQWGFKIDVEKTKEYYKEYNRPKTDADRNFYENYKDLSAEEKEFFDSFGIDVFSCLKETICIKTNETEMLNCKVYCPVCAESVSIPDIYSLPVEEIIDCHIKGILDEQDERVGRFRIDLSGNGRCPCFLPEGFICFVLYCDEIKWLLPGEPVKSDYDEMHKQHYEEAFSRLGINVTPLDRDTVAQLKTEWMNALSKKSKNQNKAKRLSEDCIWHIFSFGLLRCDDEEVASRQYDNQNKYSCVFLSNIDDVGYRIENADALSAEILDQFIDVTVIASDFSWTYVKTHECDFGPYFCKID
ncbi:MAG: DUF4275 family protein [Clostridia bacterium]|nr:DUF4275 family protein [Clostridia bacterium]